MVSEVASFVNRFSVQSNVAIISVTCFLEHEGLKASLLYTYIVQYHIVVEILGYTLTFLLAQIPFLWAGFQGNETVFLS